MNQLHCPNCGAPVNSGNCCYYCGTLYLNHFIKKYYKLKPKNIDELYELRKKQEVETKNKCEKALNIDNDIVTKEYVDSICSGVAFCEPNYLYESDTPQQGDIVFDEETSCLLIYVDSDWEQMSSLSRGK